MAFAYEVYCYYNVNTLSAVFNGVAMVVNSSGYVNLVKTIMTLGVILMAMVSLSTGKFEGMKWFIVSAIFYVGFLGPKANVTLVDRITAQTPVVIANVPLGLAFMASMSSNIGDWMTTTMESAFTTLPNTLTFGANAAKISNGETHGVVFGSKLLQETQRAVISDPNLRMDWYAFVRNCTIYDISSQRIDMAALQTTTDVMTMLGNTSVARMTSQNAAGLPAMDTCQNVYTNLKARLGVNASSEASAVGRLLNPNIAATSANSVVLGIVNQQSSDITQLMIGVSQNATSVIQQAMMINLMNSSGAVVGQQLNDPASVSIALAQAQAEATANSSYATMAKVAESAMPKIRNVIEVVIYATFPIVMLIILIAGHRAGGPLKSYFMTMIWLQLWPPLYAILNLVVTMETAKQTLAIAVARGGGLTLASASDLGEVSLSSQAIAGYMVMLIPVMAAALTKGGEQAMSSLATSLTSPAQNAASTAGAQAATGNMSLGNTSFDTHAAHSMSANKFNSNFEQMSGQTSRQMNDGGVLTQNSAGGSYGTDPKNNRTWGATLGEANVATSQQAYQEKQALTQQTQQTLTKSLGSTLTNMLDAKEGGGVSIKHSQGSSVGRDESYQKVAQTVQSIAQNLMKEHNVTSDEAAIMAGTLAAGGTAQGAAESVFDFKKDAHGKPTVSPGFHNLAKNIKSGAETTARLTGKVSDSTKAGATSGSNDSISEATSFAMKAASNANSEEAKTYTKNAGKGSSAQLQQVATAQNTYSHALSEEKSASHNLAAAQEISKRISTDLVSNPHAFDDIAAKSAYTDKEGKYHTGFSNAVYMSNPDDQEAMKASFIKTLGVDTQGAQKAGDVQEKSANLAANAPAVLDKAGDSNKAAVTDTNGKNFRKVEGDQGAVAPGAMKRGVTSAVAATKRQASMRYQQAERAVNDHELKVGQNKRVTNNEVQKGNDRGAFGALGQAMLDDPKVTAAIAAAGVGGTVSSFLQGAQSLKQAKDAVQSAAPGSSAAISAEKKLAEEAIQLEQRVKAARGDITRMQDLVKAGKAIRNGVRAAEIVEAGTGAGLPAAAAEAVVTEAAFVVAENVLNKLIESSTADLAEIAPKLASKIPPK